MIDSELGAGEVAEFVDAQAAGRRGARGGFVDGRRQGAASVDLEDGDDVNSVASSTITEGMRAAPKASEPVTRRCLVFRAQEDDIVPIAALRSFRVMVCATLSGPAIPVKCRTMARPGPGRPRSGAGLRLPRPPSGRLQDPGLGTNRRPGLAQPATGPRPGSKKTPSIRGWSPAYLAQECPTPGDVTDAIIASLARSSGSV